jgi:hypothetical protein
VLFIDFKAAFDSVTRDALWKILETYGIPAKLVKMLQALYVNTKCVVRVKEKDSPTFAVSAGVRQGAIGSPVLFNFAIDWVMQKSVERCRAEGKSIGISLGDQQITDLDYADDIVLFSEKNSDLQAFVDKVSFFGNMVGLKINPDKSKTMSFCSAPPDITIDGVRLEKVDHFRYLGSLITVDGTSEKDIECRIGFAQASFQKLSTCLFSREDISISTKMRVYLASIRSILLYGCESWSITAVLTTKLDSCETNFLRRILNVAGKIPYMSNDMVRLRCKIMEPLSAVIKRRRLTWLGHVLRMNPERLPQHILLSANDPMWRRSRGRPQKTWERVIHAETRILTDQVRHAAGRACEWSVDGKRWISYLQDLAACRDQWKEIVKNLSFSS